VCVQHARCALGPTSGSRPHTEQRQASRLEGLSRVSQLLVAGAEDHLDHRAGRHATSTLLPSSHHRLLHSWAISYSAAASVVPPSITDVMRFLARRAHEKLVGTREAADPGDALHSVTSKDRICVGTVRIDGKACVITEFEIRMLTPRELIRPRLRHRLN
jgi:hypothetical protein